MRGSEVRERRRQARHVHYERPELLAWLPNELWSWDITKLKGPVKWSYYYLYVIMDLFSRYVVGWMVAERESAELAKRLISETIRKQEADPTRLTLHADRGSSMKSKCVAMLLSELGVTKTHSRPRVSNDKAVLGKPVQNDEIQAGVSRSLRLDRRRQGILRRLLQMV